MLGVRGALVLRFLATQLSCFAFAIPTAVAQVGPADPRLQAMAATVMANPAEVQRYVALARAHPDRVGAPILLLAGQYELGRGRFAAARKLFTSALATDGDGPWRGLAESGLGWAALGQGDLSEARRHYDASGLADPATELVAALLDAADGRADAVARLFRLANGEAPAALVDVARLGLGYAQLWTGAPADAERSFATVDAPRFRDDAAYATAVARLRQHDPDGARPWLELAAAGTPAARGARPSRALLELSPAAVLRAGLRRTRGAAIVSVQDHVTTVLDGDGALLARTALHHTEAAPAPARAANVTRPAPATDAAAVRARPAQDAGRVAPAASVPRHPWGSMWLLLLAALVGAWWLRRRLIEPPGRS